MLTCSTADLQHRSIGGNEGLQDREDRFHVARRRRREHALVGILHALLKGYGQRLFAIVLHVTLIRGV